MVTDKLRVITGAALRLHPLFIVPVIIISHERNMSANTLSGWSPFCNRAVTKGSIHLKAEAKIDLNAALSDWLPAS
jgi:hypothetical protein